MANKESQLNLKIVAENKATAAFEEIQRVFESLTSTVQDAAGTLGGSWATITDSFMKGSADIGRFMGDGTQSVEGFVSKLDDQISPIQSALQTIAGSFGELTSAADKADTGLSQAFNGGESSLSTFESLVSESATSIEKSLDSIETIMDQVAMNIESQTQTIESAMLGVEQAAQQMADSMSRSAEETKSGFSDAGLLIGLQMVGQAMEGLGSKGDQMFTGAIESSAAFEGNISRIHAVLMNREPTASMQEMSDTALRLGQSSKFSANQISEGMYELARQGLSSTQILGDGVNGAIQVVNDLAQATDTSMNDTARVVTDVMHEYGLTGGQLRDVANMISGAMHSSSMTMTDFYQSMSKVGPVASGLHQPITDVSTAIALLAQHGITGQKSGTALTNMLLGLEPHTKKAAQLMSDLGISAKNGAADSFYQLNGNLKPLPDIIGILNDKFGGLNDRQKEAALATTFTKYGLAGLNTVVTESKDKFNAFKDSLMQENAADIAKEKMNNLQGDMWKVHAAVETMSKSFGNTLEPAMRKVAQATLSLVQWFTNLSPSTKETIMVVGGVASAMAAVGGAVLTFVSTLGFLQTGLRGLELSFTEVLTPVGLVVAGIALLGVGAYELYKHWDQVKAKTHEIYSEFVSLKNEAVDKVKDAFGALSDKVNTIKTGFINLKDQVLGAVQQKFKDITDSVNAHKTALEVTAGVLGTIFGPALIKTGVQAAVAGGQLAAQFTVNVIKAGAEAVVAGTKMATQFIANVTKAGAEAVVAGAKMAAQFTVAIVKSGVESVIAGGKLTASLISSVVKLGIESVITAGKITGQAIVAIITYAAEGWKTAASIGAQTTALVANAASVVAQKVAIVAGTVATATATAAQWAFNAALDANPIGIVILAIGALGFAIYELCTHFQDIKKYVEEAWNKLTTRFNELVQEGKQFGANLIHMIADGIRNAAHEVADAASHVAQQIKNFLGFHSPAAMGPAGPGESDMWMKNLVGMMASSLRAGAPQIADAAKSLAQPLADVFGGTSGSSSSVQTLTKEQLEAVQSLGKGIIDAKERYTVASQRHDQTAMDSAHALAEQYRAKLQQMGIDTTAFGQDKTIQQTVEGMHRIVNQSMDALAMQYKLNTSSMQTDNSTMDTSTTDTTDSMSTMWSDMSTKITATATQLKTQLQAAFVSIAAVVKEAAESMQKSMDMSFTSIAVSAERTASRVVAAVAEMRQAMASIGMSAGGSASVSSAITNSHSISLAGGGSNGGIPLGSGFGGGKVVNVNIHSGAIAIHGGKSEVTAEAVGGAIMKVLRQNMKFVIN